MPFSLLMTITRSTASAPICVPQLPPVIFMNAGALQPSAVRHVATPLPCSAPKMNPPFYQVGYDRYALCPLHDLVGNALVRRVHDLVQHRLRSGLQTLGQTVEHVGDRVHPARLAPRAENTSRNAAHVPQRAAAYDELGLVDAAGLQIAHHRSPALGALAERPGAQPVTFGERRAYLGKICG